MNNQTISFNQEKVILSEHKTKLYGSFLVFLKANTLGRITSESCWEIPLLTMGYCY